MTEAEFNALAAQGYNRIPVTLETFADLDTPLSVYLKLANAPNTYLLESVQGGERFGRYSIIGLAASTRIEVHGRSVLLLTNDRLVERRDYGDPLNFVAEFMDRIKVPPRDHLPRFAGGLVGCFGYDTVRYIEPRLAKTEKPDALGTPDILLLLSEEIAIVDNLSGKLTLVVYAEPEVPNAYVRAVRRLKVLLGKLREPVSVPSEQVSAPAEAVSSFGEEAFKAAVQKAKDYIVEGDIMQVVLSQRMSKPFGASPLALYRAIRSLNPSPYMFYFNFEEFQVVGASPEILVRLEDGDVTVRPIAGTRKRGATHDEDLALEAELLADREGARRAHPAPRPGPQRLRPRGPHRHRQGHRALHRRALFPRDAHRLQRGRQAQGRAQRPGRAARHFPGGHRVRRPQAAGHGDHRRAGTHQARHLRRLGGLSGLPR
jgi:anthranilate synthase component 1